MLPVVCRTFFKSQGRICKPPRRGGEGFVGFNIGAALGPLIGATFEPNSNACHAVDCCCDFVRLAAWAGED